MPGKTWAQDHWTETERQGNACVYNEAVSQRKLQGTDKAWS